MTEETLTQTGSAGEQEELLSLADAVLYLGVSKPTIYRLLERGEVKGFKVGNQWRFRRADLTAYLERSPVAVAMGGIPSALLDTELEWFAGELRGLEITPPSWESTASSEEKTLILVNQMIRLAVAMRASDIHLEAMRFGDNNVLLLRYRIDGVLHEMHRMSIELQAPMLARWKTMANMNLEERRLPQDGRIQIRIDGRNLDLRVSLNPTVFGEALVARILDPAVVLLGLEKLELMPDDLARLSGFMRRASGLLIFTGPNGSGKTTTMYSSLLEVAGPEIKTLSIEDPVEYLLPWVTQTQVNMRNGLTFASALRSFLRQDPDVIMAGETRDCDTALIIIQAALTGHLVLTSLHTTNAATALIRLIDIGVERFLVAASVAGVVSQRLVRKLCQHCKTPVEVPQASLRALGISQEELAGATFYTAPGCPACAHRGFRGRIGIYEILTFSETIARQVINGASSEELEQTAVAEGMTSLLRDGLRKAAAGLTTVEEVLRVVAP